MDEQDDPLGPSAAQLAGGFVGCWVLMVAFAVSLDPGDPDSTGKAKKQPVMPLSRPVADNKTNDSFVHSMLLVILLLGAVLLIWYEQRKGAGPVDSVFERTPLAESGMRSNEVIEHARKAARGGVQSNELIPEHARKAAALAMKAAEKQAREKAQDQVRQMAEQQLRKDAKARIREAEEHVRKEVKARVREVEERLRHEAKEQARVEAEVRAKQEVDRRLMQARQEASETARMQRMNDMLALLHDMWKTQQSQAVRLDAVLALQQELSLCTMQNQAQQLEQMTHAAMVGVTPVATPGSQDDDTDSVNVPSANPFPTDLSPTDLSRAMRMSARVIIKAKAAAVRSPKPPLRMPTTQQQQLSPKARLGCVMKLPEVLRRWKAEQEETWGEEVAEDREGQQVKKEADEQARKEAEEQARKEHTFLELPNLFEQADKEAEEQTRKEAAQQAKQEAEEQARKEAEEQARKEAEQQAKKEAEGQARKEAEEQARKEVEEQARKEAEGQARNEAEQQARKEAEEQAKKEAEEQAKREEQEEQAKKEAERQAKKEEQEEQARKEAEEQARKEAEGQASKEAEEQARKEVEEQASKEADEQAKREEQEEQARKEAERQARKEAEQQARKEEQEEQAKKEAERQARKEAEQQARKEEQEEQARQGAEEQARQGAEEQARQDAAEKHARQQVLEQARIYLGHSAAQLIQTVWRAKSKFWHHRGGRLRMETGAEGRTDEKTAGDTRKECTAGSTVVEADVQSDSTTGDEEDEVLDSWPAFGATPTKRLSPRHSIGSSHALERGMGADGAAGGTITGTDDDTATDTTDSCSDDEVRPTVQLRNLPLRKEPTRIVATPTPAPALPTSREGGREALPASCSDLFLESSGSESSDGTDSVTSSEEG
jgi:outer membrane biosynthesis protein TonB